MLHATRFVTRIVSNIKPMSNPMPAPVSRRINIFLSLDRDIFRGYFNLQDPSPVYKRQLSQEFEEYIMGTMRKAARSAVINYRISYSNELDKQYAEPLVFAIRRHFSEAKARAMVEFEKFKRRTYLLLVVSFSVVMICHWLLPLLLKGEEGVVHSGLSNSLDVFSWVILWKPIDRLIFYWNPFLKDIGVLEKLEKAETTVVSAEY
jgi:hypothetical protein